MWPGGVWGGRSAVFAVGCSSGGSAGPVPVVSRSRLAATSTPGVHGLSEGPLLVAAAQSPSDLPSGRRAGRDRSTGAWRPSHPAITGSGRLADSPLPGGAAGSRSRRDRGAPRQPPVPPCSTRRFATAPLPGQVPAPRRRDGVTDRTDAQDERHEQFLPEPVPSPDIRLPLVTVGPDQREDGAAEVSSVGGVPLAALGPMPCRTR